MAGIDSLVLQGGKSLLKDKAFEFLNPSQMEFARFAMNPQMYLAEKGITAVAELLGYGSEVKDLQNGAKDDKTYSKEIMRDALGDVLPNAIGDFVRATPRGDNSPAGTYTAWNPETQSYEQNQSSNPVATSNAFTNQQFDARYNPNSVFNPDSINYSGPAHPLFADSNAYRTNISDLMEMLQPYKAGNAKATNLDDIFGKDITPNPLVMENNTPGGDVGSGTLDFGGTMDMSDALGAYEQSPIEMGGNSGGGKGGLDDLVAMYSSYATGGQIRAGGR
jgi:hypothetical protein